MPRGTAAGFTHVRGPAAVPRPPVCSSTRLFGCSSACLPVYSAARLLVFPLSPRTAEANASFYVPRRLELNDVVAQTRLEVPELRNYRTEPPSPNGLAAVEGHSASTEWTPDVGTCRNPLGLLRPSSFPNGTDRCRRPGLSALRSTIFQHKMA